MCIVTAEEREQELAMLLAHAECHLITQMEHVARDDRSPLDPWFVDAATVAGTDRHALRAWQGLIVRANWACGGQTRMPNESEHLSTVLAAFGLSVCALEVLDDLVDGDPPAAGRQAPNLALAVLGAGLELLAALPVLRASTLLAYWGGMYGRCAAAQAHDVAATLAGCRSTDEALVVAEGSGLVTQWAVEAGSLLAGAPARLLEPLATFGRHLGTAEKLLHDLHDLWPGDHCQSPVRLSNCNLTLAAARQEGVLPKAHTPDWDDGPSLRRRLYDSGLLHYAWACSDLYRLRAASALGRFGEAGGDTSLLIPVLGLTQETYLLQGEEAELQSPEHGLLPGIHPQLFADLGRLGADGAARSAQVLGDLLV